jgi:RNA polymerase sigma factor (sigma-70 family)
MGFMRYIWVVDNIEPNELLVEKYQQGDKEALDRLIKQNEGLIHKIVNKYYTSTTNSIDREDLVQEGYLGLMRAAQLYSFNKDKKASFATYSFEWINAKISRFIHFRNTENEVSLDTPVNGEEDITFMDTLPGPDGKEFIDKIIEEDFKKEIQHWLKGSLSLKNQVVVKCRYGFYGKVYTLKETGEALGIKYDEAVRRIQQSSIRTLRKTSYGRQYTTSMLCEKLARAERMSTERAALLRIEIGKI